MKDKKRKSKNTDAKIFIENKYKQFVDSFKEKVPELSSQWLGDSDELIELVSNKLPVEECVGLWAISLNALRFITGNDDPFGRWEFKIHKDDCKFIYDWYSLFRLAKEQRYDELIKECKDFGNLMLALGYFSIYIITLFRLCLYLEDNPDLRDVLYIYHGRELEKDPKSKPYLEGAIKTIDRLAERSRDKYKKVIGNEPQPVWREKVQDRTRKLYFNVWKVINEIFKGNIYDDLTIVAKRGKDVIKIPDYVKFDLIDEYRLYEKRKSPHWGNIADVDENIKSIESISDIPKVHDIEKSIELEKWIDSIKEPVIKKIAILRYKNQLTVREISKRLDIPKSTVQDRLKKLTPPS